MTADRRPNIPTPWNLKVRRFMQGPLLQAGAFLTLALLVMFLWQRQGQAPHSVGLAEALRVNVSAATGGKLLPMYELQEGSWSAFDTVYKGQVVARLDDSELRTELAAFQVETEQLRAEVAAVEFEVEADRSTQERNHLQAAAQLAREVERARLDILDRLTDLEQSRLELGKLAAQLELAEKASASGMLSASSHAEISAGHASQTSLVAAQRSAYREAQANYQAILKRMQSQPMLHAPSIESRLSPLRAAISAAEARVEHMHARMAALEIRSPISGTIAAVNCYPGQGVRAGELIVTIAAEKADHIVAYVRSEQQIRPQEGSTVGVRLRLPASTLVMSTATRIGSQWEPMPEPLRRDPNVAEMVLPVRIAIPPQLEIRPGELVDVTFFPQGRKGI